MLSHVQLFVTPLTIASQAPLSMEFSRQEYWSGLPSPTSGDLCKPGMEPLSLVSPALTGGFFTTLHLGKSHYCIRDLQNGTFVISSLNWLARLYTHIYMERKNFPNYLVTLSYVSYKKDRLNICLSFYLSVFIIWLQHFKSNSWCFSF